MALIFAFLLGVANFALHAAVLDQRRRGLAAAAATVVSVRGRRPGTVGPPRRYGE